MPQTHDRTDSILRPGDTCWRIERADRAAMIVDAADYFRHLRAALIRAERAIYLIGWDFDLRIEMVPGQSDTEGNAPDGWPNRLGEFLKAIVDGGTELKMHILKWDGAMLAELASQGWETLSLNWSSDRIRFALDSNHPAAACHHQKIVVVDDKLAFCGGIDVTDGRWDTRAHLPDDERRADPDGNLRQPWHDVTTALEGPVAKALGELARYRWERATGEELEVPQSGSSPWPEDLEPDIHDIDIAIARTEPRYDGRPLINEIEELYLAGIRTAQDTIYIESQYLAGGSICEALEARLAEPAGPDVVIVNPLDAESFLEDEAMHSVRSLMIERLKRAARRGGGGLAIYHPVNAAGSPIYVHAKVFVIDDRLLRIGSSNIDNRSMGFDTECDVAFEARTEAERERVRTFTLSLLAEHLDRTPETIDAAWREAGSLAEAVDGLRSREGRTLLPIEPHRLDPLEKALAESRLLDPRHWPRNRTDYKAEVKHAAKRVTAPYHLEVASLSPIVLAAGLALGGYAAYRLARRSRRFPAPGIVTHRHVRPPVWRD